MFIGGGGEWDFNFFHQNRGHNRPTFTCRHSWFRTETFSVTKRYRESEPLRRWHEGRQISRVRVFGMCGGLRRKQRDRLWNRWRNRAEFLERAAGQRPFDVGRSEIEWNRFVVLYGYNNNDNANWISVTSVIRVVYRFRLNAVHMQGYAYKEMSLLGNSNPSWNILYGNK